LRVMTVTPAREGSDGVRARKSSLVSGILACLVTFLVVGCSGLNQGEAQTSDRPNIVFIVADDMRADDYEYMPQTRQLLTEGGATFEEAFVTHSLCCPSRASILRGQYTHNHQVLENNAPEGGFEKFHSMGLEDSTVATWLQGEGYQTALIGKYLNGYARRDDETYVPPGWDEWHARLGGGDYYDYQINDDGEIVQYGSDEQDYYTDVLADKAKGYVRNVADDSSPFFMYLAPSTPHGPFVPAPRHKEAYEDLEAPQPPSFDESDVDDKPAWVRDLPRLGSSDVEQVGNTYRNRLRMLLSLDEMVAGLIEELRATGELENTYVFFTSDNGYHLGEHRINVGKRTAYEEAIRVPLSVRGPGVPAGQTVKQTALNIDFAPTIADLARISAPAFVDGRSLMPLLSDAPPVAWRSAFLLEHWNGGGGAPEQTPTYAAVRTGTVKHVEHAQGDEELYDLSSDPYEMESLHASVDPALIESLRSYLEDLKACTGEACREAEDAP
jgi:N-acetylglucosamine-6-sulfatase